MMRGCRCRGVAVNDPKEAFVVKGNGNQKLHLLSLKRW